MFDLNQDIPLELYPFYSLFLHFLPVIFFKCVYDPKPVSFRKLNHLISFRLPCTYKFQVANIYINSILDICTALLRLMQQFCPIFIKIIPSLSLSVCLSFCPSGVIFQTRNYNNDRNVNWRDNRTL